MKRLEATLTALAIAIAATMAWPSTGAAILVGDELACAEGAAARGVEYAATILPKLQDACIEDPSGFCDPETADIADDHDDFVADIEETCEGLPDAFEGFCDQDEVEEIAECVADAYDAGATRVADLSVGGGPPPGPVTEVEVFVQVPVCNSVGQVCSGTGSRPCCGRLVCKLVGIEVNGEVTFKSICDAGPPPTPTPTPTYSSAVRAFIDPSRSLLE